MVVGDDCEVETNMKNKKIEEHECCCMTCYADVALISFH